MAEAKKMMNIYEAISKCMEDIGAVGKNDKNSTQGFMYRGIDAVMNAINPALVKNHVFVVPEVLEQQRTERQTNKGGTLFYSICKLVRVWIVEIKQRIRRCLSHSSMRAFKCFAFLQKKCKILMQKPPIQSFHPLHHLLHQQLQNSYTK